MSYYISFKIRETKYVFGLWNVVIKLFSENQFPSVKYNIIKRGYLDIKNVYMYGPMGDGSFHKYTGEEGCKVALNQQKKCTK